MSAMLYSAKDERRFLKLYRAQHVRLFSFRRNSFVISGVKGWMRDGMAGTPLYDQKRFDHCYETVKGGRYTEEGAEVRSAVCVENADIFVFLRREWKHFLENEPKVPSKNPNVDIAEALLWEPDNKEEVSGRERLVEEKKARSGDGIAGGKTEENKESADEEKEEDTADQNRTFTVNECTPGGKENDGKPKEEEEQSKEKGQPNVQRRMVAFYRQLANSYKKLCTEKDDIMKKEYQRSTLVAARQGVLLNCLVKVDRADGYLIVTNNTPYSIAANCHPKDDNFTSIVKIPPNSTVHVDNPVPRNRKISLDICICGDEEAPEVALKGEPVISIAA